MKVHELLTQQSGSILAEARELVRRSNLEHYEAAGDEAVRRRLQALFELTARCVADRNLAPMLEHADQVAKERFNAGFDLSEVQTAFNVLEEVIWKRIIPAVPPGELAESLGLVGTVLGAGKDRLAGAYVALATRTRTPSLDLNKLFEGRTEG
ncbi:MAG: hypothetical protein HZB25_05645 [Candidatus Eisenbacteria bacterium]|nr:hypothetical protein [Candidatus Eisenbacteria bacterium]